MKILIYADNLDHAAAVQTELRAQKHQAMTRDARFFQGMGDTEQCDALAFVKAANEDLITAAYRSTAYQERHGQIQIFNVETGAFGEPLSVPTIATAEPVAAKTERDFLNDRTDNMSDADLRTFVRGVTGQDAPDGASREDLEALIRTAKPAADKGAALTPPPAPPTPPTAPPAAAEVKPVTEASPPVETPPAPPADEAAGKGKRGKGATAANKDPA